MEKQLLTEKNLRERIALINAEKAKVLMSKLETENTSAGACTWKCAGHNKRGHNTSLN